MIYKTLRCPHCNQIHIDEDKEVNVINNGVVFDKKINFFKTPHRKHTCQYCLKTFLDDEKIKSVSILGYEIRNGLKII